MNETPRNPHSTWPFPAGQQPLQAPAQSPNAEHAAKTDPAEQDLVDEQLERDSAVAQSTRPRAP